MTREQAKELFPIIQAFAEGKTIQYRVSPSFPRPNNRDISYVKEWFDIDEDKCDGFSCDGTIDYRIKPGPKYRPFNTQEECWNEMLKHQPLGWVKDEYKYVHIECVYENEIEFSPDEGVDGTLLACTTDFTSVCEQGYTFADGTPFGIKE